MSAAPSAVVAGTAPYPWPFDGRIDGARLALVLAGWDARWKGRVHGAAGAAENVAVLAAATVAAGGAVVVVTHGDAACPVGPPARVVAAAGIDGFYGSPLDAVLRGEGRTHLLVAGHGVEGPVHSTLRSANDRGYECLLVTDACSALDPGLAAAAAHTVTMSGGIFGAVGLTADVVAALAGPPAVPVPAPSEET